MTSPIEWVVKKISGGDELELLDRPAADVIVVRAAGNRYDAVSVGVIGVKEGNHRSSCAIVF
ncbi:hypothetical protein D3C78_1534210 [compost metagenome]